jgi:hypothetical protein
VPSQNVSFPDAPPESASVPPFDELEPPLDPPLDPPELPPEELPELDELPPSPADGTPRVCPPHAHSAATATIAPNSRRISDLPI